MMNLGIRIRNLRRQSNLTQSQLAARLGLTKSVISAYENDLRLPSYDTLITIARIFKVSTDYLLGVKSKDGLDLSGLTEEEIKAITKLVEAMKKD